jgi:hypothetical protein
MNQSFGKTLTFAVTLAAGMVLFSGNLQANKKWAAQTKQKCTYCHVTAGKPDLNDTGKCFKDNNHSLDKCKAPTASIETLSAYMAELDLAGGNHKGR